MICIRFYKNWSCPKEYTQAISISILRFALRSTLKDELKGINFENNEAKEF